jgi:hypothetical protein
MNNDRSTDVNAVLELSKRFQVFPLHNTDNGVCSCGAEKCSVAKHSRIVGWQLKASNHPVQIKSWWQRWPQSNVGVLTGRRSGIFVLDVDDKNADSGSISLRRLEAEHSPLPVTLTVVTGNGRHLYFQHPRSTVLHTCRALF